MKRRFMRRLNLPLPECKARLRIRDHDDGQSGMSTEINIIVLTCSQSRRCGPTIRIVPREFIGLLIDLALLLLGHYTRVRPS